MTFVPTPDLIFLTVAAVVRDDSEIEIVVEESFVLGYESETASFDCLYDGVRVTPAVVPVHVNERTNEAEASRIVPREQRDSAISRLSGITSYALRAHLHTLESEREDIT